jgi:hypothetical protein
MRAQILLLAAWTASAPALAREVHAAEVWPSKVTVRPDGTLEYAYDLKPLKAAGKVAPDVQAETGEAAVKEFLDSLPGEVRVTADPSGASISVAAPGELEHAAPVASFGASPAGALAPSSEFDAPRATTGLPALHPDVPKVLPSVDMLIWKSRQVEDGVLASVLAASEKGSLGLPSGRRAFWNAVLEKALKRYREGEGDARDGAMALAVRIGSALRMSEGALPAALTSDERLAKAAELEPAAARVTDLNPGLIAAYDFTADIGNLENSENLLRRPLDDSRPGLAAALVFLSILEKDPKLGRAYAALRGLRDDFLGPGGEEVLDVYKATAREGAAKALDQMGDFLPEVEAKTGDWKAPRLFAPPQTPVRQFLGSLEGAERGNALDELAAALQDGRVAPDPAPKGSWAVLRESALVPLLKPEDAYGGKMVVAGTYRSRLGSAFRALFHLASDQAEGAADEGSGDDGAPTLSPRVLLKVPPHLEVEPLPTLYGRLSVGYARLREVLGSNGGAARLAGLTATGGRRPQPAKAEADQLAKLYRGLELLALRVNGTLPAGPESAAEQRRELAAAQRFLATWRNDFDFGRSVRGAGSNGDVELAVTRRQLEVAFDGTPKTTVVGCGEAKSCPFETDTAARQSYVIPVLTMAPTAERPLAHTSP